MDHISVVIPTYNAKHLLEKHLPSVAKSLDPGDEIVIVDDASTDDTLDWLEAAAEKYEKQKIALRFVQHEKNQRFAAAVNTGVQAAKHEFIWLLNNDVTPLTPNIRPKLLAWFSNPQLFAVGCAEVQEDTKDATVFGRGTGNFERGLLVHWYDSNQNNEQTLWTTGGSMMFRRSYFQELGGMDTLFAPAYEEDRDLSYRALKHGWEIAFDFTSRVWHQHETTNKSVFGERSMEINSWKNQFLIVWKNITDLNLWLQYFFWLPYHLTLTNYRTKGAVWQGFWRALKQFPHLLQSRQQAKKLWKLSDAEVLAKNGSQRRYNKSV